MSKRIYVGSLAPSANEDQLSALFTKYGSVSEVHIVSDRATGQSKGFAFVEMTDGAEADKAIAGLNGSDMNGMLLVVNEARAREGGAARS